MFCSNGDQLYYKNKSHSTCCEHLLVMHQFIHYLSTSLRKWRGQTGEGGGACGVWVREQGSCHSHREEEGCRGRQWNIPMQSERNNNSSQMMPKMESTLTVWRLCCITLILIHFQLCFQLLINVCLTHCINACGNHQIDGVHMISFYALFIIIWP